ncbi:hypothetical protein AAF712_008080 [Marasmius tenuissimus]|uniref:F-box domain-containing protein n=1 Tax=Marasmius tenuissimus TaxID=585030 RepID=A0ABR2ZU77_9AGAR
MASKANSVTHATIHDFPNEILSEIFTFTHAAHDLGSPARHPLQSDSQARMLLNVNQRWRNTAQQTRSMWQDFEITSESAPSWAQSDNLENSKRARYMMDSWLSLAYSPDHSHGRLNFIFRSGSTTSCTDLEREVLRTLIKRSHSWQYATLETHVSLISDLWPIQGNWLDLVVHGADGLPPSRQFGNVPPQEFLMDLFSVAPRLRVFSSKGVSPSTIMCHWGTTFPWQQLKRVDITQNKSVCEAYNVLKFAKSAETIRVDVTETEGFTSWRPKDVFASITLPSVQCLLYTERTGDYADNILYHLDLPNLTELSVDDSCGSLRYYQTPLERLAKSCGRNLTWLELQFSFRGDYRRQPQEWYDSLLYHARHFKALEYISLDIVVARSTVTRKLGYMVIMDNILATVGSRFERGCFECPRLEELVLRVDIADDVDTDVVRSCVGQVKKFLEESCKWEGKEALGITIVMKGPKEATKQLSKQWRDYAELGGYDEERIVILQD